MFSMLIIGFSCRTELEPNGPKKSLMGMWSKKHQNIQGEQ